MRTEDDRITSAQQDRAHLDPHIDPEAAYNITTEAAIAGLEAAHDNRDAQSLKALLNQVNAAYPGRSTASDGTIGDAAHRNRPSDHNPRILDGGFGVVTAIDITHDPEHGCDAGAIARSLRDAQDARIKYIIWNRRIANSSAIGQAPAWAWRVYTGANPHDKHCHISVKAAKSLYDDPRPWALPTSGGSEATVAAAEDDDPETLIANGLAAICGLGGKPLLQALVDAQDAIAALLSRYAEAQRVPASEGAAVEAAPSFDDLQQGYLDLWSNCRITPARAGEVAWHRSKLLMGRERYEEVGSLTATPWWFIGIVHALEASFNFAGHLHNGDPLSARTVQVPRGRPARWNPPSDWVSRL